MKMEQQYIREGINEKYRILRLFEEIFVAKQVYLRYGDDKCRLGLRKTTVGLVSFVEFCLRNILVRGQCYVLRCNLFK